MKRNRVSFALLVTILAGVAAMPARALELPAVADTFTQTYNSGSGANYGGHQALYVYSSYNRRTWLKFDVPKSNDVNFDYAFSVLPEGTTKDDVTKAVLRLWVDTVTAEGFVTVKPVSGVWLEGTLTNNGASSLITSLTSTTAIATFWVDSDNAHDYIDVDVTALVRDWFDPSSGVANYGIALEGVSGTNVVFDSTDDPDTGHGPTLHFVLGGSLDAPIGADGSIAGTGPLTFAAGGTNSSITLSPTGTGFVSLSTDALINGLRFGRGGGGMPSNVAAGNAALSVNTTGLYNVAIGNTALTLNTTGQKNIAVGSATLVANTSGHYNVAVGNAALASNTSGQWNIAIGDEALLLATTANSNVAIGGWALRQTTTVGGLTAVGTNALGSNTTGGYAMDLKGERELAKQAREGEAPGEHGFTLGELSDYAEGLGLDVKAVVSDTISLEHIQTPYIDAG